MSSPTNRAIYIGLLKNRTLLLLWSGQTVSIIGDVFFNITVMWVVYEQTKSILQSALVGVVWHLSSIIFSPIAGVFADRMNRKRIMIITNLLASLVTLILSIIIYLQGYLSSTMAIASIFLLNCFAVFMVPARNSILPDIVERNQLISANGLFSTINQSAALLGSAIAGFVISFLGPEWSILLNSLSFLFVALCISLANLPVRNIDFNSMKRSPILKDISLGWQVIKKSALLKTIVSISVLINIPSFLGPLYPALVNQILNANAATYGTIQAIGVVGAMVGGMLTGIIERKIGPGPVMVTGWALAGLCIIGVSISEILYLTMFLLFIQMFSLTISSVCLSTVIITNVTENYRGRVMGITTSISVIAIPISTLIAGWLGDILGVSSMFLIAGIMVLGTALIAWFTPQIRKVSTKTENSTNTAMEN